MNLSRLTIMLALLWGLASCGGPTDLTCDEVRAYQLAQAGKQVVAPDDLDDLEALRELPLPKASPQPQPAAGSPCLDLPPTISVGD